MTPARCDLAELCEQSGVVDALVFRRVSSTTWAHLGGLGRGRGWAGVVEVGADEPMLANSTADSADDVSVVAYPAPAHVIGPYYATGAAAVRLNNDVLVVLANPTEHLRNAPLAYCASSPAVSTTTSTRSARPSASATNSKCCMQSAL